MEKKMEWVHFRLSKKDRFNHNDAEQPLRVTFLLTTKGHREQVPKSKYTPILNYLYMSFIYAKDVQQVCLVIKTEKKTFKLYQFIIPHVLSDSTKLYLPHNFLLI